MYINTKILSHYNLSLTQIMILQICKQQRIENMENILSQYEDEILILAKLDLLDEIKGNKKDSALSKIRITKKGAEYLENIETPEVDEGDLKMSDYLFEMYIKLSEDTDRTIGNKKLVRIYVAQFRKILNLSLHEMYWLCHLFVTEFTYTKKLENIFFVRSQNVFGKFKDNIESSKLYQFYDENKDRVEKYWKKNIK